GVDVIEDIAGKDKDEAVKLYKPLVSDADPVVRSKAQGQLARLVPPPPPPAPVQTAAATPAPDPAPAPPPPVDDKVKTAAAEATAAAAEVKTATEVFEAMVADLAATTAA